MATSIGKLSKSFFLKLLVGIIILPFVFWGMGDVFRGGSQNVIATIDSEKISTQEFVRYLNQLNLSEEQMKSLPNTNLIENILSEYIGKKVMALEIEKIGITISDNSLRDIIKNDKLFFKEKKFSRTAYEKFLLTSGMTAPSFEKNIVTQESRRQFLTSLSGGIVIPDVLVKNAFNLENQIKNIKYIDLNDYYSREKPTDEEIKKIYNENQNSFITEFKTIRYAEISPQIISGDSEYNDSFFQQLDLLEHVLVGEVPIRFNQHQNRLYLDMDWEQMPADEFIIIECYRKIDPATYTDIFDDIYLKRYATALIKKQWGANLSKFNGVATLGGVTMNGEQIYSQAIEEIQRLEEQIQLSFETPIDYMIG